MYDMISIGAVKMSKDETPMSRVKVASIFKKNGIIILISSETVYISAEFAFRPNPAKKGEHLIKLLVFRM